MHFLGQEISAFQSLDWDQRISWILNLVISQITYVQISSSSFILSGSLDYRMEREISQVPQTLPVYWRHVCPTGGNSQQSSAVWLVPICVGHQRDCSVTGHICDVAGLQEQEEKTATFYTRWPRTLAVQRRALCRVTGTWSYCETSSSYLCLPQGIGLLSEGVWKGKNKELLVGISLAVSG